MVPFGLVGLTSQAILACGQELYPPKHKIKLTNIIYHEKTKMRGRNIKVLHVVSAPMDFPGGLSIFVKNLITALCKYNIQSDVVSCYRSGFSFRQKKMTIHTEYYREFRQKSIGLLWGINPISNIYNFLQKHAQEYDIIHVHSYIFFISIQAALFHWLRKSPPIVLHLHGGLQTNNYPTNSILQKIFLLFKKWIFDPVLGRFIIKQADQVISVSRNDLNYVSSVFKIPPLQNAYWIPNGVDNERFIPNPLAQKKYVTFIGRLSAIKGFDIFLNIAQKIYEKDPSLMFLIIGNYGEFANRVQEVTAKLPILYLPQISHDKILKYYHQTLVYVLPSRYEGVPTTVLEALSCGIPVVGSNVGGVAEVLTHNENGFLFDIKNINQAVNGVFQCLTPEYQKNTSLSGPGFIKRQYSWDGISRKVAEIYHKILNELHSKI